MNLIEAGRYSAKVLDHGITETKSGLPQATVRFQLKTNEGKTTELTWYGSFKDLAVEHTVKALVVCGLKGNNPAGALEIGKEVSIVVEIKKNDKGEEINVIAWVNAPGGIMKKIDPREAATKLEKFSGAVMAFRQKEGLPLNGSSQTEEKFPWEG